MYAIGKKKSLQPKKELKKEPTDSNSSAWD
jgi:hypothetical protein